MADFNNNDNNMVSDWDDPWDVAVFFVSKKKSESGSIGVNDCGYNEVVIPWKADVLCDPRRHPPNMQVDLVCDGISAMRRRRRTCSTSSSSNSNDDNNSIVRFKFNGVNFELSTCSMKDTSAGTSSTSTTTRSHWLWPVSFWPTSTSPSLTLVSNAECKTTTVLVQDRIQGALQLGHMKILSKGKVLYDSSASVQDHAAISEQLLEITKSDMRNESSSSASKKIKTSLTVMGTPRGMELKEPMKDINSMKVWNISDIMLAPIRILIFIFRLSWLLIQSFFLPFVGPSLFPHSTTTNHDETDDESSNRARHTPRAHQD